MIPCNKKLALFAHHGSVVVVVESEADGLSPTERQEVKAGQDKSTATTKARYLQILHAVFCPTGLTLFI